MRHALSGLVFAAAAVAFAGACDPALADPSPPAAPNVPATAATPAASAAPSGTPAASPQPSATPRKLGLSQQTTASFQLIDDSTNGPGTQPPEGPGFAAGNVLAPNTPYDFFSSAPLTPGVAGIGTIATTATYRLSSVDLFATAGVQRVSGSTLNASYWGESLLPNLNPHLGSTTLPYRILFPTHAGRDDGHATRASLLSGGIATADGNVKLRGGWFDLTQTDRFVFAPAALTSVNPAIAFAPAESSNNGLAGLDDWNSFSGSLPLHGIDATVTRGDATIELDDADLPALTGLGARQTMGSIVFDRGEGTRFSAQFEHVVTGGIAFGTTVPFGADPTFFTTPQGVVPESTLSGQGQTIAGLRGAFHLVPNAGLDGLVEIGRAWYDSTDQALPGSNGPGGYYHAAVIEHHGRSTASVDFYRMEPRYATMIVPYGVPEDQWSAGFAWPGQWLKSNYQLVDNSVVGINRQGYRLRYMLDKGPIEFHLEYTDVRQIEPETRSTAEQDGYVDGFYLPQLDGNATFGRQQRYGFWTAWHPKFGDVTLDIVDDTLYRPFVASHPEDQVSYEVPQAVLSYARTISPAVTVSAGLGRYALKGAFSEPIDFAERAFLAGIEAKESPRTSLLLSFRRSAEGGITTFPASPASPAFTGSLIVLEQRVNL